MKVDKDAERIKKILDGLKVICKPYGLVPEVITNLRAKYIISVKEELEPRSEYEANSSKFGSKEVGFVVILKGKSSVFSKINLEEVKKKIFSSDMGIAKVLIEFK